MRAVTAMLSVSHPSISTPPFMPGSTLRAARGGFMSVSRISQCRRRAWQAPPSRRHRAAPRARAPVPPTAPAIREPFIVTVLGFQDRGKGRKQQQGEDGHETDAGHADSKVRGYEVRHTLRREGCQDSAKPGLLSRQIRAQWILGQGIALGGISPRPRATALEPPLAMAAPAAEPVGIAQRPEQ